MSGMDDLVTWLHAQLDEDERVARAATPGAWKLWAMEVRADIDGTSNLDTTLPVAHTYHEAGLRTYNADHIATWDPARVLAEVDAKRRMLAPHATGDFPHDPDDGPGDYSWTEHCDGCGQETPCQTLRLLALPYADRPGYRNEWRPGA